MFFLMCPVLLLAQDKLQNEASNNVPRLKVIESDLTDSDYLIGMHAMRYTDECQYTRAEILYEAYFQNRLIESDCTLQTLDCSNLDVEVLYQYAYNSIYQGKEKLGKVLLGLAAYHGHLAAIDDYAVLSVSSTFAKPFEKISSYRFEFESIRKQFKYLESFEKTDTSDFWRYVEIHNPERNRFLSTIKEGFTPKTTLRAIAKMTDACSTMEQYLQQLNPYIPADTEAELRETVFPINDVLKDLRIYPANECNAFATPTGEIYLTEGLIRRYHGNPVLLAAVCAHEATHYFCMHSMVAQWKQERKKQANTILAGVAIGLNTVLQVASGGSTSSGFRSLNNSIIDICCSDAYYFEYRYGRSQEIEADIAAYRFCEEMGIGGYAYILALELLGDGNGYMRSRANSDHPTNSYRVNLLKYIHKMEHGVGNEENCFIRIH